MSPTNSQICSKKTILKLFSYYQISEEQQKRIDQLGKDIERYSNEVYGFGSGCFNSLNGEWEFRAEDDHRQRVLYNCIKLKEREIGKKLKDTMKLKCLKKRLNLWKNT